MSGEVEAFAKTAVKQLGMSQLTAKRMASTFMAMSNGMGIAAESGKDMSLNLTRLAGDMASFYNVEQSIAQTALSSVFTGETESLKKFGVVLTEANLEAFALTQGITKQYSAMSQAEKVALRYNYVLNATKNAQGDFARTSGSWANQVRILKEQWNELIGILGKGLIQALTPVVKALNEMLSYLISIGNAFASVFGGSGIKQISTNVSNIADSAGDIGTGFENANGSAQKLQKTLAGFDELNVLNSPSSGSGGSGGGSASGGGGQTIVDANVEKTQEEGISKNLKDFLQECRDILNKWKKTIPELDIHFNKTQALNDLKTLGKSILNTIAGWGSFVVTIGIKLANDLDIGNLTNLFLGLLGAAGELASAFTDAVVPALDAFYDAGLSPTIQIIGDLAADILIWLTTVFKDWSDWFVDNKDQIREFGQNLGEAIAPLTEFAGLLLQITADAIITGLDAISKAFQDIGTAIINLRPETLKSIVASLAIVGGGFVIGEGFFKLLDYFGKFTYGAEGVQKASESFRKALKETFNGDMTFGELISSTLEPFGDVFDKFVITPVKGFGNKMNELFLVPLKTILGEAQTSYSTTVNQMGASNGVLTKCKGIVSGVGGAFKGLWKVILANPIAAIVIAIGTVVAALIHLWNTNEDFRNWVIGFYNDCIKPIVAGVIAKIKDMWENHLKPLWEGSLKPTLGVIWETIKSLWDKIANVIGGIIRFISPIIAGIVGIVSGSIGTIINVISSIIDILDGDLTFLTGVFTGDWKKAWEGIMKIFTGICNNIKSVFTGVIDTIVKGVTNAINAIKRLFGAAGEDLPEDVKKNASKIKVPKGAQRMATGGIVRSPTHALIGEYPGASRNPEIVTPQNLLTEIINKGNSDMVGALYQMCQQVIGAINGLDMSVSIGDETIAQSAQRGNQAYRRRTGQPLFV